MNRKLTLLPVALVASLALATATVHADDEPLEPTDVDSSETECSILDDDPTGGDASDKADDVLDAAQAAAQYAEMLETLEPGGSADASTSCGALEQQYARAVEALEEALDRVRDSAEANEVVGDVLTAILNGESPADVVARHGSAITQEAAERRDERLAALGRSHGDEDALEDEAGSDDHEQTEGSVPDPFGHDRPAGSTSHDDDDGGRTEPADAEADESAEPTTHPVDPESDTSDDGWDGSDDVSDDGSDDVSDDGGAGGGAGAGGAGDGSTGGAESEGTATGGSFGGGRP